MVLPHFQRPVVFPIVKRLSALPVKIRAKEVHLPFAFKSFVENCVV
jgi:hypothetical protein